MQMNIVKVSSDLFYVHTELTTYEIQKTGSVFFLNELEEPCYDRSLKGIYTSFGACLEVIAMI